MEYTIEAEILFMLQYMIRVLTKMVTVDKVTNGQTLDLFSRKIPSLSMDSEKNRSQEQL